MSRPAWQLSQSELKRLAFLEYLYDEGATSQPVSVRKAPGCDAFETVSIAKAAEDRGELERLYRNERGHVIPVILTGEGTAVVEEVRDRRSTSVDRNKAARVALLRWMYDVSGHIDSTDDFPFDQILYFGHRFTEDEMIEAGRYLRRKHLVSGTSRADGALHAAIITAEGQEVVEEDHSDPVASRRAGASLTQIINGNVSGQVAQGSNIAQQQTNGLDVQSLVALLRDIRDSVQQLPASEERADLELALDEMEADASTAPPERVRQRFRNLRRIAEGVLTGAGTKLGSEVVGELPGLIDKLGTLL